VLLLAAAVDLARWLVTRAPWTTTRLALFAWWFLLGELRGLAAVARAWALTGGPFGLGSPRRRRMVFELRIRWARHHLRGVMRLFGLTLEVDGLDQVAPGRALLLIRHASLIDNLLPDALAGHAHGLGLRFVVKRELQVLPAIDIGARWIPTVFVRRGEADTAGDVARLRLVARALGPDELVAIYPEGTRHTPAKLARAQAVVAERRPDLAPLAARLRHVLPPRLTGPLTLLEEAPDADVVICAHTGFDGFETVREVWSGGLVGRTIRVRFRRHPAATVPAGREERVRWLYDRWLEVDAWVGEHLPDRPGAGELRAFYDRSYAATGDEMHRAIAWRAIGAQGKAERVLRGLDGRAATDGALRVLDVGCGDGALLEQLRLRRPRWRLAGTEIVQAPVRAAQERNPQADVRLYDGEHLPWPDGAFDVAVLSHVLEHVPDPAATLREAARVARRVVVEVPLEANLSAARASKRAGAARLGHLHRLARADVHRHARAAGLAVEGELTDPLPRAVHRFFATTPARRAAADARWLVRRTLHRAAPRAAERLFTVHHLAVLAGSPAAMSERDEPRVDQGLPEGISPEDVKDIERPGPYRDAGDPARRGETGEVGDTNIADLDEAAASDPQPDTDADPGRAGTL
jgi:1-acyl-sn-glycerol-3-phosphate acyltransferase